jgi:hypothetical protein
MQRITVLTATLAAALVSASPVAAQGHSAHHHPAGAKILMPGVVVEPVCSFARRLTGSALQECARHLTVQESHPALLASDSILYLLDARGLVDQLRRLVGQSVKLDGTVFPAGNTYLIVVDSVRAAVP